MKDSEFIDLLNLYLDHEISAADAARLEAEVQSKPARRRIYQDYCRMQKACKILAQDFAEEPADAPDRKVVAFDAGRPARRGVSFYVTGSLAAAAACVALVFVSRNQHSATTPVTTASVAVTAPALTTPAPTALAVSADAPPATRRGLERQTLNPLSLRTSDNALALTASVQNDPHFAWMKDVNLAPLQTPTSIDQVRFDVNPALKTQSRTFTSGKPLPSDVQWDHVSFRFQK